jgi:hypothetical protein
MKLQYKNYQLAKVTDQDRRELRNFFGGIKDNCSVRILNPKHILPENALDTYREKNELDFYDILPANQWTNEKLAYMLLHCGFLDSKVSKDITTFMKMAKHDLEYIGDAYRVKNPQLNFVTVEDLQRFNYRKNKEKVSHFSMVRGLIKMRWEDGLNIAVNPDYESAKMKRFNSGFALALDETDGRDPEYLLASQKLIDERQRGVKKLHNSIFDLKEQNSTERETEQSARGTKF